jgi:DNA-binding IclR family transcriptional regulator
MSVEDLKREVGDLRRDIAELSLELAVLKAEHINALEKQNQISTAIGRVVTLVFTAIGATFMAWVMKGGFFNDVGK